jgi:hypothetical protein
MLCELLSVPRSSVGGLRGDLWVSAVAFLAMWLLFLSF